MFNQKIKNQLTLDFAQGGYLIISAESFLIDRQASGCSKRTIEFYTNLLKHFISYCDSHSISLIEESSADFLRKYLLKYAEDHSPGCVTPIIHYHKIPVPSSRYYTSRASQPG